MSLKEYRRKRNFRRTPEPEAKAAAKTGRAFVVQKHDASRLHYDWRLELDGVLKSWAVPKGPSLNPRIKRLAVQVEDHPVDYGGFEGVIPAGEYGGGTVMLWDRGTWEPIGDPQAGLKNGKLKFKVFGEKLRGGWMLVRSGSARNDDGKQWLLIKERDADAATEAEREITDTKPQSVLTARDLPEIAAGTTRRAKKSSKKKQPTEFRPQLAQLAEEAPDGDDWLHEIKYDGYRIGCEIRDGAARLLTRNQLDWTERIPHLAAAAAKLPVRSAVIDGELAAVNAAGITDFQALQSAFKERKQRGLVYYAFDLLELDGKDLRELSLEERKNKLEQLCRKTKSPGPIRFSEHVIGNGPQFLVEAAKMGLEGVVCKRRDGKSHAGRASDWLKVKCMQREEFVIGGYTDPGGSRQGLGALLVGYHNGGAGLRYAGKVGTGFDAATLRDLCARLSAQAQKTSPFADLTRAPRGTHWVAPELVAQISFSNWTSDGLLRHPAFLGLREDKSARDVRQRPAKAVPARALRATPRSRHHAAEVGGIRLTHPDRVLYSEDGITKGELANYYREVAEWMLPHVARRPLVLVRCPEGTAGECFYQKHVGVGVPEELDRIAIREKDKSIDYAAVHDERGLIALAQISALEIHTWGARSDHVDAPDRLIFDLDPDEAVAWKTVVETARRFHRVFEQAGWQCFVKTTGGKGLHIIAPVNRRHTWDEVKAFTKSVAEAFVAANPNLYIAKMTKAARKGKIFIDYLRNGRGSTSVAPYSTRAKAGAPVSTPIAWNELTAKLRSNAFTVRNLPRRLARLKSDPWEGLDQVRQSISADLRERLAEAIAKSS